MAIKQLKRIAVVDDDPSEAAGLKYVAEDAGLTTAVRTELSSLSNLLDWIAEENVQGVVCDQQLRHRSAAEFDGAEAVVALMERRIPAVLVTTYSRSADDSIRLRRDKIPALLLRGDLDAESLLSSLRISFDELEGHLGTARKAHRVLVRIADVVTIDGAPMAEAILPSWEPSTSVRFPLSLIPEEIRLPGEEIKGARYMAQVNIGAERLEDLYFRDFERGPDPDHDE